MGPTHANSRIRDLIANWLGTGSWKVIVLKGAFGMLHVGGTLVHIQSIGMVLWGLEVWSIGEMGGVQMHIWRL